MFYFDSASFGEFLFCKISREMRDRKIMIERDLETKKYNIFDLFVTFAVVNILEIEIKYLKNIYLTKKYFEMKP